MTDSARAVQANSFGAVAEIYERSRPSYPPQAIDWLLPAAARKVLDLGAGTGKLTRGLLGRGLDVVAVEPSEQMLSQLTRVLPGVRALNGSAESIPLDDGAVDVVLVAQAWHWMDPDRAVAEVARVLSPGGELGLLWNLRDETQPWVAELGSIMKEAGEHVEAAEDPIVGPPFGLLEQFEVQWSQQLSRPALLDLVASRSYVITATPTARDAILQATRDLLKSHPDLVGSVDIALPYVTKCFRARLPDTAPL